MGHSLLTPALSPSRTATDRARIGSRTSQARLSQSLSRSAQAGHRRPSRGRRGSSGRAGRPTHSPATTHPASSRTYAGLQAVLGLCNGETPHARCIPGGGGRTQQDPSRSHAVAGIDESEKNNVKGERGDKG